MKVLVIAAHPDDELLGLGGTVARHASLGHEVHALVVADGATSRYEPGTEQELVEHGRRAAAILGTQIRFLGMPDQRLDASPIGEVIRPIERAVMALRPDVVYTHHWGDLNRDHRVVSEAVMVACRPVGDDYPRRLFCFETPSSTEWSSTDPAQQFVPNHFVDISAHIQQKLDAMSEYRTEVRPHPHPRALESLRARAAYWGQIIGRPYAEAFVLVREVW
jgi:LmbE family N-acetylglucosaminyl deacetylase